MAGGGTKVGAARSRIRRAQNQGKKPSEADLKLVQEHCVASIIDAAEPEIEQDSSAHDVQIVGEDSIAPLTVVDVSNRAGGDVQNVAQIVDSNIDLKQQLTRAAIADSMPDALKLTRRMIRDGSAPPNLRLQAAFKILDLGLQERQSSVVKDAAATMHKLSHVLQLRQDAKNAQTVDNSPVDK